MPAINSHEYAKRMQEVADYLLSKPAFAAPSYSEHHREHFWYMGDKAGFIAAVRTLGPAGAKKISRDYVDFTPTGAPLDLRIERNVICKLVRAAEYDCEPLLAPGELEDVTMTPEIAEATTSDADVPF